MIVKLIDVMAEAMIVVYTKPYSFNHDVTDTVDLPQSWMLSISLRK